MTDGLPPLPHDAQVPQARPIAAGHPLVASPVPAPIECWGLPASPLNLDNVPARTIWLDLAIMVAGLFALDAIVSILLKQVAPSLLGIEDERFLNVWGLLIRGAAWSGFIIALVRSRNLPLTSVALTSRRLGLELVLGWPVAGAAYAVFLVIALTLYVLVPGLRDELAANGLEITKMLPRMSPAALVGLQLAVGAYEELAFRGFLLTRLRRGLHSWTAATVVSSAVFALLHLSSQRPVAAIPIFGLGVVFCCFVIWRRSLVPAIIGHAIFNSGQLLYIYYTTPQWT